MGLPNIGVSRSNWGWVLQLAGGGGGGTGDLLRTFGFDSRTLLIYPATSSGDRSTFCPYRRTLTVNRSTLQISPFSMPQFVGAGANWVCLALYVRPAEPRLQFAPHFWR